MFQAKSFNNFFKRMKNKIKLEIRKKSAIIITPLYSAIITFEISYFYF